MAITTPELDGTRLQVRGEHAIWVIMHGRRRWIAGPQVNDGLFAPDVGPVIVDSVDHIERGPDLAEGSCLAQAEGAHALYLVAGGPDGHPHKHHITSPDAFRDFGFDGAKVRVVPPLILAAVPDGDAIVVGRSQP